MAIIYINKIIHIRTYGNIPISELEIIKLQKSNQKFSRDHSINVLHTYIHTFIYTNVYVEHYFNV